MTEGLCIREGVVESYTGREESVTVPEGIHAIGEGAFKGCVSLKKVILPSSLRSIGQGAFKGCRRLLEVEIPEGVSYVGDYAFHRCHSLERIALPSTVTELGDCVFLYCDSLREAKIPGVRRLGRQAFLNDVCLSSITISRELREDDIFDVFTGCGKITQISFSDGESFHFPTAVEVFLGEIMAPSLVHAIVTDILRMMELDGRCLIRFLTNLKHVEVPEGIYRIGKSCFFDKRGIISVKLPASLEEIDDRAFRNCISLEKILLGNEHTSIHEDAFKNCSSLKHIETCDGRTWSLQGLSAAKGKTVPELVRVIHEQVLGNFRISGTILLQYLGEESRVVVPDGITVIGERAFAGSEAVDRVILPESVRQIGREAFKDCLLLQTITFVESICRIGEGAFENCVKLIRADLPQALARIEKRVFKRCRTLREVVFGTALTKIGEQAFYGCVSLKGLEFPEGISSIGKLAFFRCGGLREVVLPENIVEVGSLAFAQSGVKRVSILAKGSGFGSDVFAGCIRLRTLVFGEKTCHISDRFAYGCSALDKVVLPELMESVGKNVLEKTPFLEEWREKVRKGTGQAGTVFWDGSFLERKVQLPDWVEILAGGAFYGNRKITEVYLPAGIRWVGAAAFKGCDRLRFVKWPEKIRKLEQEVFSGCTGLEMIGGDVPWKSVGERAFYGCRNLQKVCLSHARWIGKEAFAGCINLGKSAVKEEENPISLEESAVKEEENLISFEKNAVKGEENPARLPAQETELGKVWIGENAFEGTSFPGKGSDGQAVVGRIVVSGQSCEGEIHIREGITRIAPFAFAANRNLTKVIFPESLSEIGEGAFWGCDNLLEVIFPDGICLVGARAFEKCSSLGKVLLNAPQVGAGAFSWCEALVYAELPEVRLLEAGLFEGCGNLEICISQKAEEIKERCFSGCVKLQIVACENNGKRSSMSAEKCGLRTSKTSPGFLLGNVWRIGSYAFDRCDSLRKVTFQEGVCLEPHGFEDCGGLEEITIADGTGEICLREYAFSGCTALKLVRLKGREYYFHVYQDIRAESLPEVVRLLFYSAMSCFVVEREEKLCAYLGKGRTVKIPKGIRRIEAEAFRDALTLTEIQIPDSVEYIGPRAFHGTDWLSGRRRESALVVVNGMLLDGSCAEGEVTIPEDIRLVCGWAFANGMKIRKIRFWPKRVPVKVEEYAFRNCIYLEEMELPDGTCIHMGGIEDRERELPALAKQAAMERLNCFKTDEQGVLLECTGNLYHILLPDGITAIGEGAFQNSNLLTDITFPETVKEIRKGAFMCCKWLKEVWSAKGVERIEEMAFSGCGTLEKVELSERLQFVGARAFEHCTNLKEIRIPEGVTEIPARAFYRCHSLKRVVLPLSLRQIGEEAFAFCREMEEIQMPEDVDVMERAFVGCAFCR